VRRLSFTYIFFICICNLGLGCSIVAAGTNYNSDSTELQQRHSSFRPFQMVGLATIFTFVNFGTYFCSTLMFCSPCEKNGCCDDCGRHFLHMNFHRSAVAVDKAALAVANCSLRQNRMKLEVELHMTVVDHMLHNQMIDYNLHSSAQSQHIAGRSLDPSGMQVALMSHSDHNYCLASGYSNF
jgi:hypothetical protein